MKPLEVDDSSVLGENDLDVHISQGVSCCSVILAGLQLKSAPLRMTEVHLKTQEVRKFSLLLCGLMIGVGVLLSDWFYDDPLAKASDDACLSPEDQLATYTEQIANSTGFYLAAQHRKYANISEAVLYEKEVANTANWNLGPCTAGVVCDWPKPFSSDCAIIKVQPDRVCGKAKDGILKFFGKDKFCFTPSPYYIDPCLGGKQETTEPEATQGGTITYNSTATGSNAIVEVLDEVVHRIRIASSVYCLWVAAMIYVGPAFSVYSYSAKTRAQNFIGGVNKFSFIVGIVLGWYIFEIIRKFMIDNPSMMKLLILAQKDPCFVDSDFLINLFSAYSGMCSQIEKDKAAFDNSNYWISYYRGIEQTYIDGGVQTTPGSAKSVYAAYSQPSWTAGCDALDVLDSLEVPDTHSTGMFYLVNSGYVASMFVQPLLCNLLWYFFEVIKPLSAFNGRVIMDQNQVPKVASNVSTFDGFIVAKNIVWLVLNLLALLVVLANLFFTGSFEW